MTSASTAASPGTAAASPGATPGTVTVRYFAAAAEAAGTATEQVPAGTADAVRAALVASHGADLERVLTRCSLLADGLRVTGRDAVAPGATLDVLPPFAGG